MQKIIVSRRNDAVISSPCKVRNKIGLITGKKIRKTQLINGSQLLYDTQKIDNLTELTVSQLVIKCMQCKGITASALLYNRYNSKGAFMIRLNAAVLIDGVNFAVQNVPIKKVFLHWQKMADGTAAETYSFLICGNFLRKLKRDIILVAQNNLK